MRAEVSSPYWCARHWLDLGELEAHAHARVAAEAVECSARFLCRGRVAEEALGAVGVHVGAEVPAATKVDALSAPRDRTNAQRQS